MCGFSASQLLLAERRPYFVVVKVRAPHLLPEAARHKLQGHVVTFLHDAGDVVSAMFDQAHIDNALQSMRAVFVGTGGQAGKLELEALYPRLRDAQCRWNVVHRHLVVNYAIKLWNLTGRKSSVDMAQAAEEFSALWLPPQYSCMMRMAFCFSPYKAFWRIRLLVDLPYGLRGTCPCTIRLPCAAHGAARVGIIPL